MEIIQNRNQTNHIKLKTFLNMTDIFTVHILCCDAVTKVTAVWISLY